MLNAAAPNKSSLAIFVALVALSLSAGQLRGQTDAATFVDHPILAGSHRPATVPEDYVITPFGYFHPSCVQRISEGETLLADGRLQHPGGAVDANAPACKFPRYAHDGSRIIAAVRHTPEINGWVESASMVATAPNESFSAIVALWAVPPAPKNDDGQTLFYFPGLEDINNTVSILQPVLQWSGGQWVVANWNCCLNNITTESTPILVHPRDEIVGSIDSDCKPGKLSCATWTIFSLDLHNGKSTTLKETPSDGQIFNWAFGGVMEPYSVIDCSDYPANKDLTFDIVVFNQKSLPIFDPVWTPAVNTTDTPQCSYGIKATKYDIAVDY
jgi:hypothetical protein